MQTTVTDVARSVICLSVCWSHGCALLKRLNGLRCRLGLTWVGPINHVWDGVEIPHGNGQFWGWSSPMKSSGNLCCGVCSERDHAILDNSITANCNGPNWSVSQLHCPREKSTPVQCGLSSKFFDNLFTVCHDRRFKFSSYGKQVCNYNGYSKSAVDCIIPWYSSTPQGSRMFIWVAYT